MTTSTKRKCTEEDCESPYLAKGYCRKHYRAHGLDASHGRKYLHTAECAWCGTAFSKETSNKARMKSCSDECHRALSASGIRKTWPSCKVHIQPCAECRNLFASQRERLCCSKECTSKHGYETGKEARLTILREQYTPKPPRIVECATCKELFSVKGPGLYCMPCGLINTKTQRRDYEKRRDAQKRGVDGVKTERIKVAHIYDRDAWSCGVCGQRVDKALTYPHLMSASLDHIVPLAHGGTHTKANVQLAHFLCNSKKSDRLDMPSLRKRDI